MDLVRQTRLHLTSRISVLSADGRHRLWNSSDRSNPCAERLWTGTVKEYVSINATQSSSWSFRDVYLVSSASAAGMAKYEKSEQLVVGGLGLGSALFNGQPEIKAWTVQKILER